jgi:UDP-3-O-[3-hydroxymyristoyl] glucosamine N-acyltransferase
MPVAITSGDIAKMLGVLVVGDESVVLTHIAPLYRAEKHALSFVNQARYLPQLKDCGASAVILKPEWVSHNPTISIVSGNPYLSYAQAAAMLHPPRDSAEEIHPSAVIAENAVIAEKVSVGPNATISGHAQISEGVEIGAGCHIGENVSIGAYTVLKANVVVEHSCRIGRQCLLQPGVVIGGDGFGYAADKRQWVHIPQLGRVLVGDRVEIGANTTIDRGALDDTIIGDGVILDNQIQIAHNVVIGENTAIAGCVGIAGSAKIGKQCTIGGGTGVLGHLEIVDDVHINAMSMVVSSIVKPGSYSSGTPLDETPKWRKNFARFKGLNDMAKRLRAIEKKLQSFD